MLYLANPSTGPIRQAMSEGLLGCIVTPGQGNKLPPPPVAFAVDNGCGPGKAGIGAGYPGDREYLLFLSRMSARARERCLFAVAPDVVCDARASAVRLERFYAAMRGWFGLPVAFAAQNGLEDLDVPWCSFDVLFLGGDTAWKLGPAARALAREAKERRKKVHMGRVNSLKRLRYAEAIGCDTADGTFLTFAPDQNLRVVLGWDRAVNGQGTLWGESSQLAPSPSAVLWPPAIHPAARRRSTGTTPPAYGVCAGGPCAG
jgi:hypothetical protein